MENFFEIRKEEVKKQFEHIYGIKYDDTLTRLKDKLLLTPSEDPKIENLRKRITRTKANSKYVEVALGDALFALALFVTPRGKEERKKKHDSWKRTFDAFGELSIVAHRISKSHLKELNRKLVKKGETEWPFDIRRRALSAQRVISSQIILETRGRSQSPISFFAQKVFEAIEDLIGGDLRRSYELANDKKDGRVIVTFTNSHPQLIHDLTCVVFPNATAKQVRAALKQIPAKKSGKNTG
ncbi:hypothetical protein [Agrobacterium sp. ST15.13.015]|uniref:hypothetical protein n=1 Tax=Agrobacterium sp. ST15.13.015 TaxID=3017319 RepID=UPI0022C63B3A|nr:hypothetical protein [Agrobacterium sp. ST15.13.015]MCZ7498691.1 hypothetical protein [Rhizobium rhizogenes]